MRYTTFTKKLWLGTFLITLGVFFGVYNTVFAAVPTRDIGFQGQLYTGSTPVNTSVSATFTFYDAPSGGSVQGTPITKTVAVTNGYFSTTFSEADMSGIDTAQSLWIQVVVNGDTLAPRSTVNAVPLANNAFGVLAYNSAPSVGVAGTLYYDTATQELYVSNGSTWNTVSSSTTSVWGDVAGGISYTGGNVGIGTTSPASLLHINSNDFANFIIQGNDQAINFIEAGADATDIEAPSSSIRSSGGDDSFSISTNLDRLNLAATGDINISNSANGNVYIAHNGNVGVGTTDPNGALTVQYKFDKADTTDRNVLSLKSSDAFADNPWTLRIGAQGGGSIGDRYFSLQTSESGVADGGNLILQPGAGFVGIGTTTPDTLFTVQGSGAYGGKFNIDDELGNPSISLTSYQDAHTLKIQQLYGAGRVDFSVNGTEALSILNANRNVGIGTTTPGSKLTVDGDINFTGDLLKNGVALASAFTTDGSSNIFSSLSGTPLSGSNNFFSGPQAGGNNQTTGDGNIFMGLQAGYSNTSGYQNIALGTASLVGLDGGSNNISLGYYAGQHNTAGSENIFAGNQAGNQNVSGSQNVFLGVSSGYSNIDGTHNVFIGYGAGDTNTNGSYNTIIGKNADVGSSGLSNATAIGNGAIVNASNALVLGDNTVNVGIGTSSPAYKLDVYDPNNAVVARLFSGYEANDKNYASTLIGNGVGITEAAQFGYVRDLINPYDSFAHITPLGMSEGAAFVVNASGYVGIGTSTPSTTLTVDGGAYFTGNVGIGTSSPFSTFSVNGDVAITGGIYDSTATRGASGMVLQTTGTGTQWVATSSLGITATNYWSLNGSNLYNNSGTNVGLGTTTPLGRLTVVGTTTSSGKAFSLTNSSGNEKLYISDAGSIHTASTIFAQGGGSIQWGDSGIAGSITGFLSNSSDGVFRFGDSAGGGSPRIILGSASSGWPSLKRNGAGLDIRTGDDSGYTYITGSSFVAASSTATSTFAGGLSVGTTTSSASLTIVGSSTNNLLSISTPSGTKLFTIGSTGRISASGGGSDGYMEMPTGGILGGVRFGRTDGTHIGAFAWYSAPAMLVVPSAYIGFNSTATLEGGALDGDVRLYRDAADMLAQRHGTTAQTFRVYNTYTDASNYERGAVSWSGNALSIGTEHSGTGAPRSLGFTIGSSTRMMISTAGNVGIGSTTSPGVRLDVVNGSGETALRVTGEGTPVATTFTASFQHNGGDRDTWIELLNGITGQGAFFGLNSVSGTAATGDSFEMWNYQGGPIVFYTNSAAANGTERLRIAPNGNIGIGTSSPAFPLDVYTTVSSNQTYGYLNELGVTGTSAGTNSYSIRAVGRILAPEFNAVSDVRLKDVQFEMDSKIALDAISNLRPVSFTWKKDPTGQPVIGFLAQDVETIIPNAVSKISTENFTDQRSLDYNQIVAMLVGAVKEIKLKIDTLGEKVSSMTAWFRPDGKLDIKNDICIDDVCVTKEQFKQLLLNNGAGAHYSAPSTPTPTPEPTESEPTPAVDNTDEEEEVVPTPEITPEPVAETPVEPVAPIETPTENNAE